MFHLSLHKYNRRYSALLLNDIYSVFFQHVIVHKDISAANLQYVMTKLDLVTNNACDKTLFGCRYFHVECSYRPVERQISLAASLR